MIRLFEPSMGLPLSRRFRLLELSDEVNQGLGLIAVLGQFRMLNFLSSIAHKTNHPTAFRLSIVFRRGLSV